MTHGRGSLAVCDVVGRMGVHDLWLTGPWVPFRDILPHWGSCMSRMLASLNWLFSRTWSAVPFLFVFNCMTLIIGGG